MAKLLEFVTRSGRQCGNRSIFVLGLAAATVLLAQPARAQPANADSAFFTAPVRNEPWGPRSAAVPAATASTSPNVQGFFGAPVAWPIVPIHVTLLPDGRVMNYGTNQKGALGSSKIFDVWDPSQGTGSNAHLLLPNGTATNIFCSGLSFLWGSDEVLTAGGGGPTSSEFQTPNASATLFNPQSNTIQSTGQMQFPRWYPTLVAQPNGEMLVLGGREDADTTPTITPEVYNASTGWRTLTGASSAAAFGGSVSGRAQSNWYYPRGFLAPNGQTFVLGTDGAMYYVSPAGSGTVTTLALKTRSGPNDTPSVMFAPGQILSLRGAGHAVVINLNGQTPTATATANLSTYRIWSNGIVLADGRVLINGGSPTPNQLSGAPLYVEIWDPATKTWTIGASASVARMYHSTSLLLPDGSVLTAGGTSPTINLNAEIYYPSYLYDSSGQPAARPSLQSSVQSVVNGQQFTATVGAADLINRVTFVRAGSSTHSNDTDQRFLQLTFAQTGTQLTITLPNQPTVLLPGLWLLFAFNQVGVPSIAQLIIVQR